MTVLPMQPPSRPLWQPAAGGEVARPDGTTITGDARVKLNGLRRREGFVC